MREGEQWGSEEGRKSDMRESSHVSESLPFVHSQMDKNGVKTA